MEAAELPSVEAFRLDLGVSPKQHILTSVVKIILGPDDSQKSFLT